MNNILSVSLLDSSARIMKNWPFGIKVGGACLLITHNSFSLILLSLSCSYSHDPAHSSSCMLEMKIKFIVRGWNSIFKDKNNLIIMLLIKELSASSTKKWWRGEREWITVGLKMDVFQICSSILLRILAFSLTGSLSLGLSVVYLSSTSNNVVLTESE